MGLDMFAYTAPRSAITRPVDFETDPNAEPFHQWRKHPDLHGWMERLYRLKGGVEETFNLVPVELTASDLQDLEAAVIAGNLPATKGFFFGRSTGAEREGDLRFIAEARKAIANGLAVYYDASW